MTTASIDRNPSDPHTAAQSGAVCRAPRPAACALANSAMALEKAPNTHVSSTAARRMTATPSHPPSNLAPATQANCGCALSPLMRIPWWETQWLSLVAWMLEHPGHLYFCACIFARYLCALARPSGNSIRASRTMKPARPASRASHDHRNPTVMLKTTKAAKASSQSTTV